MKSATNKNLVPV